MQQLANVPQQHTFKNVTGEEIYNLHQLQSTLNKISFDEFRHHVNSSKNDYAAWVRNVVKDAGLAHDLERTNDLAETKRIIDDRIAELELEKDINKREQQRQVSKPAIKPKPIVKPKPTPRQAAKPRQNLDALAFPNQEPQKPVYQSPAKVMPHADEVPKPHDPPTPPKQKPKTKQQEAYNWNLEDTKHSYSVENMNPVRKFIHLHITYILVGAVALLIGFLLGQVF